MKVTSFVLLSNSLDNVCNVLGWANRERSRQAIREQRSGRAVLSIYSGENEAGDTPLDYLRKNFRANRVTVYYQRITRSFFAISMERNELIYYSRCNFSGGTRGATHCFDLVYPQEEKRTWDLVVTRISGVRHG